MASASDTIPMPSRRRFFGSAVGAGVAAAGPPIFTTASTALATSCLDAIAHRKWIDIASRAGDWDDDRLNAECGIVIAAINAAASTPSQGIADIVAKARLGLDHMEMHEDDKVFGLGLVASVLREIIALPV